MIKKFLIAFYLFCLICLSGCSLFSGKSAKSYEDCYDSFTDKGQFTMPKQKFGKLYWTLKSSSLQGSERIMDDLLSESVVGLMALAVNENRSDVMAWMENKGDVYLRIKAQLPMNELGTLPVWELLNRTEIKQTISGYVLYDTDNQESINVACVAAHVYNGVMIEKRDRNKIEQMGYQLLYNASKKKLADSWSEFKDKCNNNALVLMPGFTSNQRSTAIAYRLMVVNLNKVSYKPELGSNKELIENILMWLNPLSPVFGWEQGVGEDSFVGLVSRSGNLMIPYDWTINTPLLSAEYEKRQAGRVKVTNPTKINYGDAPHYMSFYMSDGDNVQWMLTGFDNANYFSSSDISKTRMTFGFPVMNLSMISPDQNNFLLSKQNVDASLMESLGGGYLYADNFAELKDRAVFLDKIAKYVGIHMRQHRNNVLALVCNDVVSDKAREAYNAYIRNNDQLIGIVVIQYTPYAGGAGKTLWFVNSKGYKIPVITVRYSLWNYGEGVNGKMEGTPAYIAARYNDLAKGSKESTFSARSVHAWSKFTKVNNPRDLVGENAPDGDLYGVVTALMCQERLDPGIKVVNIEELIWQLRMHTYPDQTKELLKTYE